MTLALDASMRSIDVQISFGWKARIYLKLLTVWCIITMREPDHDKVVERLVKLADIKIISVAK